MRDALALAIALLTILLGVELFTNGIEWVGRKLELAEGAVGSVLAAAGTAMPETVIPLIAILFTAGHGGDNIGVGAVLGAPFMLSTLAMFVTGLMVMIASWSRASGDTMTVDVAVLTRDIRTFGIAYGLAIATALLPADLSWTRWACAVVLIGIYIRYVRQHFQADADPEAPALVPLRLHRLDRRAHRRDPAVPMLRIVNLQVLAAIIFIVAGAAFFVDSVERLAGQLKVNEALLALIVAPIATELPEALNAMIWVRRGKDTLAMANITGAMVFQATVTTVVAMVFASTAWAATAQGGLAFASAAIAFLSSAAIFLPMIRSGRLRGRELLVGGLFYLVYIVFVIGTAGSS